MKQIKNAELRMQNKNEKESDILHSSFYIFHSSLESHV
jgi:hypothetical protein